MRGCATACRWRVLFALFVTGAALLLTPAWSAAAFNPIVPTKSNETVTLNGQRLTIEQVVDVARFGAQVRLAPAARQRSEDAYELLLEGARQNMPIYWFNRAPGSGRETVIFEGDPLSPQNEQLLLERQMNAFRRGVRSGIGPEVADEEIVRAMMVVRANTMVYEAATPQLTQMLLDLLNNYVSPVVQSRGSPGEGDLPMMSNIGAAMVGAGQAYLRGQRMPARQALAQAGLQPLEPFAADDAALTSTNAYSAGQAALLLYDSKRMLDWSDLTFAMSMLGLNSSITPLTAVPQNARPFPYQNKLARRLLNLVRGSYLFDYEAPPGFDGRRIIQDPLSFRDYSQRNGSLWEAYARLKKNILIQINSSDHNPAVVPGSSPSDSWELDTPWLRRYFVEEGDAGVSGFILSNANFVALPWGNDLEMFTINLANALAAHVQRVLRFPDTFFTVVAPGDVLSEDVLANAPPQGASYTISDLMAEIQTLANPVPAQGNALVRNVEDMETYTRQRVARARLAVDDALRLVAQEMLSASYWMEVREAQNPDRSFGAAPASALQALRAVIPWQQAPDLRPELPAGELVYAFLQAVPAATFMGGDAAEPTAVRSRTRRAATRGKRKRAVLRRQARERTPGPQALIVRK
jgi:histidine ammonia-lyase